jgi:predicted MPP superfamily phosphohydrolase
MTVPASKVENSPESEAQTVSAAPSRSELRHSRIFSFLAVGSMILLTGTLFVSATWNHFWKNSAPLAWVLVPLILTLTFIGTTILARRFSNVVLRLAYMVSAIWLGVFSLSLFAAFGCWISALLLSPFDIAPKIIAGAFYGCALLASIYGFVNASTPRVTRITAKLANLPQAWQGRSVALVTDLHLGNVRGAGFTRRIVNILRKLQPDAILIAGDLFDGSKGDFDALVEPWKFISPPSGIYFVTGNHEEFSSPTPFVEAIRGAGIRVLNNEKVDIEGMQIVGVFDGELHDLQGYRNVLRRAGLDRNRPSILLAHQPVNMAIAEDEGVSLQVSGHTHGGQMWPWTLIARRVHGPFNHGLNRLGKLLVYTSYGVGTWGAPMRVGTKSEIVLIRLESALS